MKLGPRQSNGNDLSSSNPSHRAAAAGGVSSGGGGGGGGIGNARASATTKLITASAAPTSAASQALRSPRPSPATLTGGGGFQRARSLLPTTGRNNNSSSSSMSDPAPVPVPAPVPAPAADVDYVYQTTPLGFGAAQASCAAMGWRGHVVSIANQTENDYIFNNYCKTVPCWIGLTRVNVSGVKTWSWYNDGLGGGAQTLFAFDNFHSSELKTGDCAIMRPSYSGQWRDQTNCDAIAYPYVCEFKDFPPPSPPP
eukprot:CAMPEP_0197578266 /NCGR_PEP_ID=MMETSP1326-20131121/2557_1 /TAXON_ID=1155430 /ORGANISM="Genus nov. species nov., Strain RCC2288" /LENGTH=253 /DNA_ID=CAMNT_0043141435 /DNA_START=250 /DNA_END=1009 /DNA_ORIENTATION=+